MKRRETISSRIVVITGTSSGIGKECKSFFEKKGDTVVCLSRTNPDNFDNFFACDVSNEDNVIQVFDKIKKEFKKIDVLINNAGFGVSGAIELTSNSDIEKIYDVNVIGAINTVKYALPLMSRGASIINISSVCAFFPLPYRTFYCATKSSLSMFSYGLKMECKPLGINVVAVCPSDTKTNFTKNRVKIYKTNDRYKNRIQTATDFIDSKEGKRMSVTKVAEIIYKQSTKKKTKPYVIIGAKYKFLNFMMRFLPLNALLFFTEKFFGGHQKESKDDK